MVKLSVVAPLFNEEDIILDFCNTTFNTLKDIDYELILVNDGSKDKSLKVIKNIKNEHLKIISFSRNFGKDAAIYAGLKNSSGEYTCIIDSDLQQNPKYLLTMLSFLESNKEYDSICMIQKSTKQRKFETIFYKTISKMSSLDFHEGASDFRMFTQKMVNSILDFSEKIRFSKGIFAYSGFNVKYEEYEVEERTKGKSKFNLKNKIKYAIEGIVGFSTFPLLIPSFITIILSSLTFIYGLTLLILLILSIKLSIINLLLFIMLLMFCILFGCLSILCTYISKMYIEVKNRPNHIIKEKIGFDDNFL